MKPNDKKNPKNKSEILQPRFQASHDQDGYVLAVDENLAGAIPFLEFVGLPVIRPARGQPDQQIHDTLELMADSHTAWAAKQRVVFFTRDHGFLRYLDRSYFLYYLALPPQSTMDQARLILTILEQDLPKRTEPMFEVSIKHIFRRGEGNSVMLIESAIP